MRRNQRAGWGAEVIAAGLCLLGGLAGTGAALHAADKNAEPPLLAWALGGTKNGEKPQPAPLTKATAEQKARVLDDLPPLVREGWTVYLNKGDTNAALALFQRAGAETTVTFLTAGSLSQMHLQRAEFTESATVLLGALRAAKWDLWAEPALCDLQSILDYHPDRAPFTAAVQERLAKADLGWIEREALRELHARLLRLDGKENELLQLRKAQEFMESWLVLGPFSNRNREGFTAPHPLEATLPQLDLGAYWPGRGRTVSWFALKTPPLSGRIDLGAALSPGEESLAWCCAFVSCMDPGEKTLVVTAGGASELWLNGAKIYTDNTYCNTNGPIQRLIPVTLRKGINQVLFKIASDQDSRATLAMRVIPLPRAELDKPGSAVRADEESGRQRLTIEPGDQETYAQTLPAAAAQRALKDNPDGSSGESGIWWGALEEFAQRLRQNPADPLALLNQAYLLREHGLSDEQFSRQREYDQRALELYPQCPLFMGNLAYAQPDENRRRQLLEEGVKISPAERSLAEGILMIRLSGGFFDEARDQAQELLKVRPTSAAYDALGAVYTQNGWWPEATAALRKALELQPSSADLLIRLSRALPMGKERLDCLKSGLQKSFSPATLSALTQAQRETGDLAGWLESAKRLTHLYPDTAAYWLDAASAYVALNDFAKAAETIRAGIGWLPQAEVLIEKHGRLLLAAGKRAEGLAQFDLALAIKGDNPNLRAYIKALAPAQDSFFTHVEIPFAELAGKDKASKDYPEHNALILLDQAYIRVAPNGTARRMYRSVTKALRQAGAEAAGTHEIYYTPGKQRVEVIRARLVHPDGTVSDNADISDHRYGESGQASMMYGAEGMVRSINFPQAREGSIIDVQWTVEDAGEQLYHNQFSDGYFFGGLDPALRFRYTVEYPSDLPLRFAVSGAETGREAEYQPKKGEREGRAVLDWQVNNVPGISLEPAMPPLSEIKPQIGVTTFRDWQQLGEWAWSLFSPQMELSAEMKKKVAELTAPAKTREEKIKAIFDFVTDEIRYVSISFGKFGYTPHKVERTFRSRYGDCKDTAALFAAMLREAGVEAYPVLVRTSELGADPLALPRSDIFDHSIAYVPAAAGSEAKHYWLDGTTDYFPLGMIPFMDRGTKALVFGPGRGESLTIDPAAPEQNVDVNTFRITFAPGGAGEGEVGLHLTGEIVMGLMGMLEKPQAFEYTIDNMIKQRYPGGSISEVKLSKPGQTGEATISLKIKAPGLAVRSGGEYKARALFFPIDLSRLGSLPERKYDLLLGLPRIMKKHTALTLPAGAQFRSLPADTTLEVPAASFTRKTVKSANGATIEMTLTFRKDRVTAAEYPKFKEFCNAVTAAADELIVYTEAVAVTAQAQKQDAPDATEPK